MAHQLRKGHSVPFMVYVLDAMISLVILTLGVLASEG